MNSIASEWHSTTPHSQLRQPVARAQSSKLTQQPFFACNISFALLCRGNILSIIVRTVNAFRPSLVAVDFHLLH